MADLHRLIAWLVLAAGALFWTSAHASFPAAGGGNTPEYRIDPHSYASQYSAQASWRWISSASSACSQFATDFANYNSGANWSMSPTGSIVGSVATPTDVSPATGNSVGTCREDHQINGSGAGFNTTTLYGRLKPVPYSCPSNATLSGSSCTCVSGYVEQNSGGAYSCVSVQQATCSAKAGQAAGRYNFQTNISQGGGSPIGTYYLCEPAGTGVATDGCTVRLDADMGVIMEPGGKYVAQGPGVFTGGTCNPLTDGGGGTSGTTSGTQDTSSPGNNPAPTPCPAGTVPGTVNGVTICVPPGPTSPTQTKTEQTTTTTNGDGSTTSQETSTQSNCDGVTCTKTTTTSTTTTVNGTSTTVVTSSATTCKAGSAGCGTGDGDGSDSRFGGSCSAGFTCEGDAVQCATAQAAWQQKCALIDATSDERTLFEQIKAGTASGGTLGSTTVAISSASFDSSNALGVSGVCITDRTITVWGTSVTLPLSSVCPHLATLGTILQAISWLVAMGIVFRR